MGHDRRERSGSAAVGPGDTRSDVPLDAPPIGVLTAGLWGGGSPVPEREPSRSGAALSPELTPAHRQRGAPRARTRSRIARSRISQRGRYVRAIPARGVLRDLAWDATLRTAATPSEGPMAVTLDVRDLLRKQRARRPDRLLLFVVDASGSMASELTALARSAAVLALRDAYVARERVAMIAFRAKSAELLFGPTNRVERARRSLDDLPLGGTTPLARGLELAHDTLRQAAARDPDGRSTLILISDGRANVGSRSGYESVLAEVDAACLALAAQPRVRIIMVDATEAGKDARPAQRIAQRLGAERIALADARRAGGDAALVLRDALRRDTLRSATG